MLDYINRLDLLILEYLFLMTNLLGVARYLEIVTVYVLF